MKSGLLFTDSLRLAMKYHCQQGVVCNIIEDFVCKSLKVGITWSVLDLGVSDYSSFMENEISWQSYQAILDDYYLGMGMVPDEKYSLFIIGGDDVIPMPCVRNDAALNPDKTRERYLDADLLYCFNSNAIEIDSEGFVNIRKLLSSKPRFNVGRLPLEDGDMKTSIFEDIGSYFSRSIDEFKNNGCKGIKVSSILMTSCFDTETSAREIAKSFPTPSMPCEDYVHKNIVKSPELDATDAGKLTSYKRLLNCADMLLFVLHGSPIRGHCSYYGHKQDEFTEAFNMNCLGSANARVMNPVCCWGARFIGYERKESILLSALYDKALLFTGSCRSVYGRFSGKLHGLFPIGYGEIFLKLYSNYLLQGYDAGYACLKAKLDYFTTYSAIDSPERSFGTLMMFNLFGNPLLNVEPILKQSPVFISDGSETMLPTNLLQKNFTPIQYHTLFSRNEKSEVKKTALDSKTRKTTDALSQYVLRSLGYKSYQLDSVRQVLKGNSTSFLYNFSNDSETNGMGSVYFEVDESGKLMDSIYEY